LRAAREELFGVIAFRDAEIAVHRESARGADR
jgi:hypothetical protein